MDKLTTLIIDDEDGGRSTLRSFLTKYCPDTTLVAEASSVAEGARCIEALRPALVFLDINMPEENGFELFSRFPEPDFQVVFVTAYDSYALQAIKQHALDYLLKPINIEELIAVVVRARHLAAPKTPAPEASGSMLQLVQRTRGLEKIALPVLDGFVYVPLADVVRCEAEGNYTLFHFTNRSPLLVCRTLGSYEDLLRTEGFLRVHHHHLINLAHVERYHRGRGGLVTLHGGAEVVVSQRRRDEFLRLMETRGML